MMLEGIVYLQDVTLDHVPGFATSCIPLFRTFLGADVLKHIDIAVGVTKWTSLSPDEASKHFTGLVGFCCEEMISQGAQACSVDREGFASTQRYHQAHNILDVILVRFEESLVMDIQSQFVK